jgi:hypothetical protein
VSENAKTVILGGQTIQDRLREAIIDECKRELATDFRRTVPEILNFWGGKLGLSADEMGDLILATKN